jgi:hypothetical protein
VKTVLEELATAGVRYQALEEAFRSVEPDHGDVASLWEMRDRANERLTHALRDYIVTAGELRRWASKKGVTP